MVVERREAQRARSRRPAQADRSVARATPEAWAGGNIRPRGVAHDPAPPGAPLGMRVAFRDRGFGKTRTRRRRENAGAYRGGGNYYSAAAFAARCGRRSRKCGKISSAIAVMLARAISFGMVPNWVLVSEVLKPARS